MVIAVLLASMPAANLSDHCLTVIYSRVPVSTRLSDSAASACLGVSLMYLNSSQHILRSGHARSNPTQRHDYSVNYVVKVGGRADERWTSKT